MMHVSLFLYELRNLFQVVTLLAYIREVVGSNLDQDSDSTAWSYFPVYLQSLQANYGVALQIRPRPLPYTFFTIPFSLNLII
jgi:hypothetical protein